MKKRLCILQVTPESPNQDHVSLFRNKIDCDFYFVTHDKEHPEAMEYCPNTTWTDTRNILAKNVPKNYDYYAFVDYDYVLRPQGDLGPLEQILSDLDKFNPAVLTYYPGNGMHTPFATDKEYFEKFEHSVIPFTHCGLKVVHHSLMNWFFPMLTRFGGGVEACHFFNIQELSFMKNVICSHKMLYDNGITDLESPHNKDGAWSKYKMDQSWEWVNWAFKKNSLIQKLGNSPNNKQFYWDEENKVHRASGGDPRFVLDSLDIKKVFVGLFKQREIEPSKSPRDVNYYDVSKIEKFFDLSHEAFINKGLDISQQMEEMDEGFAKEVEDILRKEVTYDTLKTKTNPWFAVAKSVNAKLQNRRDVTNIECVEIFQKMPNNDSIFYKNAHLNKDLEEYLSGKTVAIVGPAPYLMGQRKGALIDSHDVVVRIQPEIYNPEDYGSRTDIIQSCMNSAYSPKIVKYLDKIQKEDYPKFIISNDTVARETHPGSKIWFDVIKEYEDYLKHYGVPFAHLKGPDGTWDRWALYWEVYAKKQIDKVSRFYIPYSGNFNSGYGAYNMLLAYPLKKLSVYGMNFYNFGKYEKIEDKYNPAYIKAQGSDGTYLGPDTVLHDQMSQMMHCKNVLVKDPRLELDEEVHMGLHEEELSKRIDKFKKLPKVSHFTQ